MDLGAGDIYLARVHWFPDGSLGAEVRRCHFFWGGVGIDDAAF
jgi:hypothetical protein